MRHGEDRGISVAELSLCEPLFKLWLETTYTISGNIQSPEAMHYICIYPLKPVLKLITRASF